MLPREGLDRGIHFFEDGYRAAVECRGYITECSELVEHCWYFVVNFFVLLEHVSCPLFVSSVLKTVCVSFVAKLTHSVLFSVSKFEMLGS